jgi:MFS family permease
MHSRKKVALFGMIISNFSRFLFLFATSFPLVFTAKLFDRTNQGMFKAPSDALIADLSIPSLRGRCYGLKETFSKVGSLSGACLSFVVLSLSPNNFRMVFACALVPGILSCLVFYFFVSEPKTKEIQITHEIPEKEKENPSTLKEILVLFPKPYWDVLLTTFIMKLAHFGNGLFLLRGREIGVETAMIPLIIVLIYTTTCLIAYPSGQLYDRFNRKRIFLVGLLFMGLSHFTLGFFRSTTGFIFGVILWGIYQGITQTALASMVSDKSPKHLRGTGFGLFRLTIGFSTLFGNFLAGFFWTHFSSSFSFLLASSIVCLFGFALFLRSLFYNCNYFIFSKKDN